jgi:hypothetical protein
MFLKMRSRWIILPLALLATVHLHADSVTLVTGEKVIGTIKDETDSEVVIDVPVSSSITDERVIRKEDIAKIEKEQPDEIAYRQLIAIQPSSELSYTSQTYDQILTSINDFLTKYPDSAYAPEIQKLAVAFQDEKRHVDAGQLKYLGEWLSKDEVARRQIQIVALQYYHNMQQQAAAGDLVGAMQTFDAIEKNYPTTRSYPAAVTLALQILNRLDQDLVVRMQEVKADQDQLQKTIDFTAEPEKSSIIAAAKAEKDRADTIIEQAVKSGEKWVPLIPRSQVSIDTLQKTTASESSRLAGIPVATMEQSIDKVDAARNAIATGDLKDAGPLLDDATKLWAQNEAAHYWGDRLKEKLATPTPTPIPKATPAPLPTVAPHPAAQVAAVAAAPPPPPLEDKPFYMTLQGAISVAAGVLIVGGLAANYVQKKARKKAAE